MPRISTTRRLHRRHTVPDRDFRTSLVFKSLVSALEAAFPNLTIHTTDLIPWVLQDYGPRQPRSYAESKLAIVGMACRTPRGSNDLDLF
ncbi:polyketide synthase [Penicillium maclennaniae]|uniref:polyketide synthase n=1 Tax=Penicillium maclennaniae TaxID=1343394 RepID=UPI0025407C99|nr:polyketide synthase [Penicillium maclennaniae]KAJ5667888.1 polyketide synthase [Penicillium maclennaniae]